MRLVLDIPNGKNIGDLVKINHPQATDETFKVIGLIIDCSKNKASYQYKIRSLKTKLEITVNPQSIIPV